MLATDTAENLFDYAEQQSASDTQRFNSLVDAHANFLYRYAYWLCRNRALAEDLVQETLLRAWKHFGKLQDIQAVKGWLTTILRREHARLYERAQVDIDAEALLDQLPAPADHDRSSEAFALREALARLPEKFREPLMLQVLGGYSCEDIASIMDLSKGAVMTRLFRAKEKLRWSLVRDKQTLEASL